MSDQRPFGFGGRDPRPDIGLKVLMIMAGVILLLPGGCTFYLFYRDIIGGMAQGLYGWLAICLLLGAGGVLLIVRAIWRMVNP